MSSGRLQEIKNNGKSLNFQARQTLIGGGHLLEVTTTRL